MMQAGISALVLKTHFEEITNPDYVINRNLKSENMCTTDTCACILVQACKGIVCFYFYSNSLDRTLFYSNMTLNEPKTHHQTPMTCAYGYSPFKTVATVDTMFNV